MIDETTTKPAMKRARKMAREPEAKDPNFLQVGQGQAAQAVSTVTKPPSKIALILGMLQRNDGATLELMVEATGWQAHTTRAALTGLRKKGHAIARSKVGSETRYTITAAPAQ